jgi:hypothetical protein
MCRTPQGRATLQDWIPRHLNVSGHIEPGSSGNLRLGREMAYPSSPSTHSSCRRVLDMFSIDKIASILFMLPVKWAISYMNIFTVLIN